MLILLRYSTGDYQDACIFSRWHRSYFDNDRLYYRKPVRFNNPAFSLTLSLITNIRSIGYNN